MHYILDEHGTPVAEPDQDAFMTWFATYDRVIARDHVGETVISTVFLAIDHNFSASATPVLWETMIFGGLFSDFQQRATSRSLALQNHAFILAEVRTSLTMTMIKLGEFAANGISGQGKLVGKPFAAWAEDHLMGGFHVFYCGRYIGFEQKQDAAVFMLSDWYTPAADHSDPLT